MDICMEKPTPKFKVGDTIYFQSNWSSGSYVPDMMTVFGVRVVEEDGEWHVKYRKKRMRWEIDEREVFGTEAEAQRSEAQRFVMDTRKCLKELLDACREEGIEDEAMACITNKRLLGEDETDNKTHFNVGDTVWGYLYGAHGSSYLPEKYVISEVLNGDDELIYRVRGHGTLMVCEANLHPTYKDALMDSVHDIIRDTKGRLYAIGKTCERLNIEFNTPTLLPN